MPLEDAIPARMKSLVRNRLFLNSDLLDCHILVGYRNWRTQESKGTVHLLSPEDRCTHVYVAATLALHYSGIMETMADKFTLMGAIEGDAETVQGAITSDGSRFLCVYSNQGRGINYFNDRVCEGGIRCYAVDALNRGLEVVLEDLTIQVIQ